MKSDSPVGDDMGQCWMEAGDSTVRDMTERMGDLLTEETQTGAEPQELNTPTISKSQYQNIRVFWHG